MVVVVAAVGVGVGVVVVVVVVVVVRVVVSVVDQASWVAGSDWYVRCHKSKACAGIGFTLTHVLLGRSPPYSVTILRKWNNKYVSAIPVCLVGV